MDKIEVIPNVINLQEIKTLLNDVDVKNTGSEDFYFIDVGEKYGLKKTKCSDHPIVRKVIDTLNISNVESVSLLYYPTGAYNSPHADNCIIDNGVVTRVKPWTHTAIIFLNDNFQGGELVYPHQGCVFYPTIGTMVITPAGEKYIHYVNKVTVGERYTLVFRINGNEQWRVMYD